MKKMNRTTTIAALALAGASLLGSTGVADAKPDHAAAGRGPAFKITGDDILWKNGNNIGWTSDFSVHADHVGRDAKGSFVMVRDHETHGGSEWTIEIDVENVVRYGESGQVCFDGIATETRRKPDALEASVRTGKPRRMFLVDGIDGAPDEIKDEVGRCTEGPYAGRFGSVVDGDIRFHEGSLPR